MIRNLQSELYEHLDRDETLLWEGEPQHGIIFRKSDTFMIPFSLVWCSFAIFWLLSVISIGAPVFFVLFGIPFVIFGLILAFGRFFINAKQRANTVYGLTENRVIIKSGIFSKDIKSLNLRTLNDIGLSEKGNGRGTITFGSKSHYITNNLSGVPQLELIDDARNVYRQIIELQNR